MLSPAPEREKGGRERGFRKEKRNFYGKRDFFHFWPPKNMIFSFFQKISNFGFFPKMPRNTLVLRYLGVVFEFEPPSPLFCTTLVPQIVPQFVVHSLNVPQFVVHIFYTPHVIPSTPLCFEPQIPYFVAQIVPQFAALAVSYTHLTLPTILLV